jgi:hypothetical protein
MASLREGEILGQGASEERGEEARSSIFAGAIAISGTLHHFSPPPICIYVVQILIRNDR